MIGLYGDVRNYVQKKRKLFPTDRAEEEITLIKSMSIASKNVKKGMHEDATFRDVFPSASRS